jgi:hypothetical protein
MTYEYEDQEGNVHEATQRITDPAYTHRDPSTGEWYTKRCAAEEISDQIPSAWRVKRIISGPSEFTLKEGPSGSWSSGGYGHSPAQLNAMRKLGRPLTRRV